MKKRIVRAAALSVAVLLFVTLFSGCYFLPKEEEVLEPPLKVPEAVSYKTHTVEKGTIERYLTGTGKFESTSTEILYYKTTNGRLKEIYVKSGDEVHAGDLIVELDTGDLEYTIYKQEKAVRSAELTLELATKNASPDPIAVERAQINYDLAAKALQKTRDKYKKAADADEKAALADEVYAGERNLRLLEMALEQAKNPGDSAQAEVERAQINYDLAAAQLDIYRAQLEESRLYAETDGTVIYVADVEPGDYISSYYDLVKIADADHLRITMKADDTDELNVGTELEVTYKSKDGGTVIGRVVQLPTDVPVTASEAERTAVKIEVDDIPEGVGIGDTVSISLLLERKEDIIVLPMRYISTYSSRRYVRVLNDEGVPEERDVKLGIQSNNEVEIVSGLEEGDVIVI
ncbi:MAG: biotin/lipoyl-binding protein [Eubacteriales bacterium]|nr:biotin/lipoyl-binding protein [Eubacteriales bacterium]MDY3285838.1 biotin/lipoyl-binding protein [Eubacteriales bacterium]MDY5015390.1 biotin/lipoyl-binding protein [Eubacteriales bacterium]